MERQRVATAVAAQVWHRTTPWKTLIMVAAPARVLKAFRDLTKQVHPDKNPYDDDEAAAAADAVAAAEAITDSDICLAILQEQGIRLGTYDLP